MTETIGQRLDALLESIDSVPSLQLYAAIVTSVVFSFVILNTGSHNAGLFQNNEQQRTISSSQRKGSPTMKSNTANYTNTSFDRTKDNDQNQPQIKWYLLKTLNFAVAISFVISITKFSSDASTYITDSISILKFLCAWSLCLCYFLGFFGMSFVDSEDLCSVPTAPPAGATSPVAAVHKKQVSK